MTLTGITVGDSLVSPLPAPTGDQAPLGELNVGETWTYKYSYTVTQADLDALKVLNTASADSAQTEPQTVTVTVPASGTPFMKATKTATETTYTKVGELLHYTVVLENTGNLTLSGVTLVDDHVADMSLVVPTESGLANGLMEVGETWTYTYTYAVTQADLDKGFVLNKVTADSAQTNPVETTKTVPASQTPSLVVSKKATETTYAKVGDLLHYTIQVSNTGNVTLTGITISDTLIDPLPAPTGDQAPFGELNVGETWTYTYSYSVTQADLDAGRVLNKVTVDSTQTDPTETTQTVPASQTPSLTVVKKAAETTYAKVGDVLNYTIEVKNSGNVTLKGITVGDSLVSPLPAPTGDQAPLGELNVGETWTYKYSYTITQADLDKGSVLNAFTADSEQTTPVTGTETVPATQTPALTVSKKASETTYAKAGDVLNYTVVVSNTGNISLTTLAVSDSRVSLTGIVPVESMKDDDILEVGETWTYKYTYTVTQADVDSGSVLNAFTADSDQTLPETGSNTVPATQTPGLSVTKSANKDSFTHLGELISYSVIVKNTGNVSLTNVVFADSLKGISAPVLTGDNAPLGILDVGETWTYAYTYTIQQSDLDAGEVLNLASVTTNQTTTPGTDDAAVYKPSYTVAKEATEDRFYQANDTLHYTLTVVNTGKVAVKDLEVSDTLVPRSSMTLTGDANLDGHLDVGETWKFSYAYTVTAADVTAGFVLNQATAKDPNNPDEPVGDVVTVTKPSYTVVKEAAEDRFFKANDTLHYTVTIVNTGKVAVKDLVVSDTLVPRSSMTLTGDNNHDGHLDVGETWKLAYAYTVTAADVKAGFVLNRATASDPLNPDEPVNDEESTPLAAMSVSKTALSERFGKVGDVLAYQVVVSNIGQVAIEKLSVRDSKVDLGAITPQESLVTNGILDVGEEWTYAYTYTVTQADLDRGSVVNAVSATNPSNPDHPQTDEVTTPLSAMRVTKTALNDSFSKVGDVLAYEVVVSNIGQTAISSVSITDSKVDLGAITPEESDVANGVLDVGEDWVYAYTYTVTQADLDLGSVRNAVSVASPDVPGNPAEDDVETPLLTFVVRKSVAETSFNKEGDILHYTVEVINTSAAPIRGIRVRDSKVDLSAIAPKESLVANGILDAHETWIYAYAYTVTEQDVAKGSVGNLASAEHPANPGQPEQDQVETPHYGLTISKQADKAGFTKADEVLTYTVVITNTGSVAIAGLKVADSLVDLGAIAPSESLAPNGILDAGESWTYTYTYRTTLADLARRLVRNGVTATDPDKPAHPVTDEVVTPYQQGAPAGGLITINVGDSYE